MPTYFGRTVEGTNASTSGYDQWFRNKAHITGFICPGAGNQAIKELSAYVMSLSIPRVIRVAIYDSSHNLVAQGSSPAVAGTTPAWYGHLAPEEITPNPAIIIGGAQYDLAFAVPAYVYRYWEPGDANAYTYQLYLNYYTDGFPQTLGDVTNYGGLVSIRCGVDPAAASYTLPADSGSYIKSGQIAALRAARRLAAGPDSYALAGQAAGLRATMRLPAAPDSYALTGNPVDLRLGRKIAAGLGSYSLIGQDVVLRAIRRLAVEGGSYVYAGQDANLALGDHYVLVAEPGSYGEPYSKIFVTLDGKIYKKMGNSYLRLS